MHIYTPPISERATEDLIIIANCTNDDWQLDAIQQAADELNKRGVSKDQQEEWLKQINEQEIEIKIALEKQHVVNSKISYSRGEMLVIFLTAPFLLRGFNSSNRVEFEKLREENFLKKYKQRIILVIGGFSFWILIGFLGFQESERNRQKEIDNADISKWEKNRISPGEKFDDRNDSDSTLYRRK